VHVVSRSYAFIYIRTTLSPLPDEQRLGFCVSIVCGPSYADELNVAVIPVNQMFCSNYLRSYLVNKTRQDMVIKQTPRRDVTVVFVCPRERDVTEMLFVFRYGSDAGQFTQHVVHTAGGVAAASYNLSKLGFSHVAREAAADSVIALSSSASSAAAAGAAADSKSTDKLAASKQKESDTPPAYSVNSPVDDVLPVDDVPPESHAVASAK